MRKKIKKKLSPHSLILTFVTDYREEYKRFWKDNIIQHMQHIVI